MTRSEIKASHAEVPRLPARRIGRLPSTAELLATTGTIESLAAMREEINRATETGEVAPSAKTRRLWEETLWCRVFELMERQPRSAPYIYNVTLRWPKPSELEAALWAQMKRVTAPLPSDAELEAKRQALAGLKVLL